MVPLSGLAAFPTPATAFPPLPIQGCVSSGRSFYPSTSLHKKGTKKGKGKALSEEDDDDDDEYEPPSKKPKNSKESAAEEVFNFEEHFEKLTSQIDKTLAKLKDDLSRVRAGGAGGRGSPATILENILVILGKSTGGSVPLRDLAHVVPKGGRQLMVNVFEADNVKKVISAIQMQNLNLQPVQDQKNPTQLNIPLPPPTKESRMETAEQAGKTGEAGLNALRLVRQASHKKIKGLDKKQARPDDVRKADAKLEKMMKDAGEEAKKLVEATKKAIIEG